MGKERLGRLYHGTEEGRSLSNVRLRRATFWRRLERQLALIR